MPLRIKGRRPMSRLPMTPIMEVSIDTAVPGRELRGGPHDRGHRLQQAAAQSRRDVGEPLPRPDPLLLLARVPGAVRVGARGLLRGTPLATAPPAGHPGTAV